MENKPKWLSELNGTIPESAYGRRINMYAVAYEAWRRGLGLSFESVYSKNLNRHFIEYNIYDKDKNIRFNQNRPSSVSRNAIKTTSSRLATRRLLAKNDIPVLKSKRVSVSTFKKSIIEKENFNYPVNISIPVGGRRYKRVASAENLEELIKVIENQIGTYKSDQFLLEETFRGKRHRAYIVDDEVIGIYKKITPYVTGDDKKKISELLDESNNIRNSIPSIENLKIGLDDKVKKELEKQNFTLDTIPASGKTVKLKPNSTDPVDATESVSNSVKSELVRVMRVIPGLIQGEIEFFYNSNTDEYKVLAINSRPHIRNYLYLLEGQSRNIPKAIIDYHFPETKGKYLSDTTPKFYFDFDVINDGLRNNRLLKVFMPKHRYEPNLVSKIIEFKSSFDVNKLEEIISKDFIKFEFEGMFKALNNKQFELNIAGNYQDVASFIDYLKSKEYISNIVSDDYNYGIIVGYKFSDLRSD